MMKSLCFRVCVKVHATTRVADVQAYIDEALRTMTGALRPPGKYGDELLDAGDPMWGQLRKATDVKVTRMQTKDTQK